MSGHQYRWLAGGYNLEIGHFLEVASIVTSWWMDSGFIALCILLVEGANIHERVPILKMCSILNLDGNQDYDYTQLHYHMCCSQLFMIPQITLYLAYFYQKYMPARQCHCIGFVFLGTLHNSAS